jgi:hypothetical protein
MNYYLPFSIKNELLNNGKKIVHFSSRQVATKNKDWMQGQYAIMDLLIGRNYH